MNLTYSVYFLSAGLTLHLASLKTRAPADLAVGTSYIGNNIVEPDVVLGEDCQIGPNVAIGKGCTIGNGVRIRDSVLLHRVTVRPEPLKCQIMEQVGGKRCVQRSQKFNALVCPF